MRKPIMMESRIEQIDWPTDKINQVIEKLSKYLLDYYLEQERKERLSKYAIMGPVGRLLPCILAGQFENIPDSYVGFVVNIHKQENKRSLDPEGYKKLKEAVETILEVKKGITPRSFHRIMRAIDYGVFFNTSAGIAKS
jgi:hypothetical protein